MAKAIRDVYGETLKKYGAMNENIVVLDADVSGSTKSAMFGKEYPDRFRSEEHTSELQSLV